MTRTYSHKVFDLVQQKGFYPYEYMSNFEKFKEQLSSKEKFYRFLTGWKITGKEHEPALNVWNKFITTCN